MNTANAQDTILIIDKYSNTLAQLIASLEDNHYNTIIADNFADTARIIEYHNTTIVCAIINIIEPIKENVFSSLTSILEIEQAKKIPLVVFTSKLPPKYISKFYDIGVFQLIEKPCNNDHLTRSIINIARINKTNQNHAITNNAYQALLDNTPAEIVAITKEYGITEWNKTFAKQHSDFYPGLNYFNVCYGENYLEQTEHPVTLAKESKKTEQGIVTVMRDHKKHHDNIIATPILNDNGKITAIIVQSFNQTSQIAMEQKLRRQVQRYNRILKEQDRTTDYLIRTQKDLQEKTIELEKLSTTDSLTGICNRRKLDIDLKAEALRAARYKHPLTLMMIDIDNFKKINDTYGHLTGDTVLKSLAQVILSTIRETDTTARYGGEEFVIILPETEHDIAIVIAERLRYSIEQNRIPSEYGELGVTVSIGVVSVFSDNITPQELLQHSDECLYKAKESGKNRVTSIEIKK